MTKKIILLSLFISILTFSFGQRNAEIFKNIDSSRNYQFKIINDTILEFSTIWRHMQPSIRANFMYNKTDSTIEILKETLELNKSNQNGITVKIFEEFKNSILKKIDGGYIDENKNHIFISKSVLEKNSMTLYIVDGKRYLQNNGKFNGYGLLQKKGKENRELNKRLRNLTAENCKIEIVKGGLKTYERLGIEGVNGAIIITTRK